MKINANLIRVGNVLKYNEKLLQVLNTNIIKPGKGGAYIQVEMRDLKSGTKINERWRTSDDIEKVSVDEFSVTYLFTQNNLITLMNDDTFEQITAEISILGDKINVLQDGMKLTAELIDGEIFNIKLPRNIKVKIQNADAVTKGQTASTSYKNAMTTKNIKILVPPHIKEGDEIIINSDNFEYVEKAKN
tara:strand:+ start:840 stop:1406 length:567 start_codon:yes stop_codon:yes gene_type:complete